MYEEQLLGKAALICIYLMLFFIFLQGWLGKKSSTLQVRTARHTDKRVHQTNDINGGIRAIKINAWEQLFSDAMGNICEVETYAMISVFSIPAITMSLIMVLSLALYLELNIYYYSLRIFE